MSGLISSSPKLKCYSNLEILLDSKIATTSDSTFLGKFVHRPDSSVLEFSAPPAPFETQLYQQLWARYWNIKEFRPLFDHAKEIAAHLGQWCGDKYWSFAFGEAKSRKLEVKLQRRAQRTRNFAPFDLDAQVAQLHQAHEDIQSYHIRPPRLSEMDLSSKVIKLFEILLGIFQAFPDSRCLVFVERRSTARLLNELAKQTGNDHIKPGMLVGATGGADMAGLQWTIREQVIAISRFRRGILNCLFATSVAEEGLDIQSCGYVIRFDPCKTMIQYVQSRGRARQKDALFIHLLAENQFHDRQRLLTMQQSENIMRQFCQLLPKDRILAGNKDDIKDALVRNNGKRVYVEPNTGSKLTYDFSLVVLAHFVASLVSHN